MSYFAWTTSPTCYWENGNANGRPLKPNYYYKPSLSILFFIFYFLLGFPIDPNPNGHETSLLSFQVKQTFTLKLCVQELRWSLWYLTYMESLGIWDCVLQQDPILWEDCMLLNWTLRHKRVIYEYHNNGRLNW